MTSLYCVSAVQSHTLTPFVQSVFRNQLSTLISSKSVLTLALEERPPTVCILLSHYSFRDVLEQDNHLLRSGNPHTVVRNDA